LLGCQRQVKHNVLFPMIISVMDWRDPASPCEGETIAGTTRSAKRRRGIAPSI
jgi:hypothetical protein